MSDPDTDVTGRAYWNERVDEADRFMSMVILPHPAAECGEPLVSLQQAADAADVRVMFSTRPRVDGLPRLYCLSDGQIPGLVGTAAEMNEHGWIMRVEHGLRTAQMQEVLGLAPRFLDAVPKSVTWELGG
jgi:hypothetical protein